MTVQVMHGVKVPVFQVRFQVWVTDCGAANNVEAGNLRVPHKVIEGTSYRQKSFDGLLSYDFSDKVTLGVNGSILIQTLTLLQRTPEAMMTLV